jgi:hypothetical protein
MNKKYIVRLTDEERETLRSVVKKLSGSSQKVRRAQIFRKADVDGTNWTDKRIAEAFSCRTKTVKNTGRQMPQGSGNLTNYEVYGGCSQVASDQSPNELPPS